MSDPNWKGPPWKNRRMIVRTTLLFCAAEIAYITGWGEPNSLNEAIVTGAYLLAGSTIGSYVFGAVWDDKGRG